MEIFKLLDRLLVAEDDAFFFARAGRYVKRIYLNCDSVGCHNSYKEIVDNVNDMTLKASFPWHNFLLLFS